MDLFQYIDVFLQLFAETNEQDAWKTYFKRFLIQLLSPTEQTFIGAVDYVPVTTGLLIVSKDIYSIYDVMTIEEARGNRYGSVFLIFTDTNNP